MFQWLIEITLTPGGNRKVWAEHGPEHDDKPTAKAWLRRCEVDDSMPQLTAGARLRLAERPLLTRTIVVIEGLDDDEGDASATVKGPRKKRGQAPDAGVTQEQHNAIRQAAAGIETPASPAALPPAATRPCECGAHRLRFDQAEIAVGDEMHLDGGKSCYRLAPQGVGGRMIRVKIGDPVPPPITVAPEYAAAVAADDGTDDEGDEGEAETLDRPPLPPSQDDAAGEGAPPPPSVAAAIAADVLPDAPTAKLTGKIVEIFDGNEWFWQRYQTENVAGRTFKAINDAIEQGNTAEQLSGKFTVFMKCAAKDGPAPIEGAA